MTGSFPGVDWSGVTDAAPDLARAAEQCFGARRMKCVATMRRSGWPRLSETSGVLVAAGHMWLLMIPSAKVNDIRADARVGVHCGSPSDEWAPSVRLTGWAHEASPDRRAVLYEVRPSLASRDASLAVFTMGIAEVVVTGPDPQGEQIVVEWWTPDRGVQRSARPNG